MRIFEHIKHHEQIKELEMMHNDIFNHFEKNRKSNNFFATDNLFEKIKNINDKISEICLQKNINEETRGWINEKFKELLRIDFETSIDNKIELHKEDTQLIINFLKQEQL